MPPSSSSPSQRGRHRGHHPSLRMVGMRGRGYRRKGEMTLDSLPEVVALGAVVDHLARGGNVLKATDVFEAEVQARKYPMDPSWFASSTDRRNEKDDNYPKHHDDETTSHGEGRGRRGLLLLKKDRKNSLRSYGTHSIDNEGSIVTWDSRHQTWVTVPRDGDETIMTYRTGRDDDDEEEDDDDDDDDDDEDDDDDDNDTRTYDDGADTRTYTTGYTFRTVDDYDDDQSLGRFSFGGELKDILATFGRRGGTEPSYHEDLHQRGESRSSNSSSPPMSTVSVDTYKSNNGRQVDRDVPMVSKGGNSVSRKSTLDEQTNLECDGIEIDVERRDEVEEMEANGSRGEHASTATPTKDIGSTKDTKLTSIPPKTDDVRSFLSRNRIKIVDATHENNASRNEDERVEELPSKGIVRCQSIEGKESNKSLGSVQEIKSFGSMFGIERTLSEEEKDMKLQATSTISTSEKRVDTLVIPESTRRLPTLDKRWTDQDDSSFHAKNLISIHSSIRHTEITTRRGTDTKERGKDAGEHVAPKTGVITKGKDDLSQHDDLVVDADMSTRHKSISRSSVTNQVSSQSPATAADQDFGLINMWDNMISATTGKQHGNIGFLPSIPLQGELKHGSDTSVRDVTVSDTINKENPPSLSPSGIDSSGMKRQLSSSSIHKKSGRNVGRWFGFREVLKQRKHVKSDASIMEDQGFERGLSFLDALPPSAPTFSVDSVTPPWTIDGTTKQIRTSDTSIFEHQGIDERLSFLPSSQRETQNMKIDTDSVAIAEVKAQKGLTYSDANRSSNVEDSEDSSVHPSKQIDGEAGVVGNAEPVSDSPTLIAGKWFVQLYIASMVAPCGTCYASLDEDFESGMSDRVEPVCPAKPFPKPTDEDIYDHSAQIEMVLEKSRRKRNWSRKKSQVGQVRGRMSRN